MFFRTIRTAEFYVLFDQQRHNFDKFMNLPTACITVIEDRLKKIRLGGVPEGALVLLQGLVEGLWQLLGPTQRDLDAG